MNRALTKNGDTFVPGAQGKRPCAPPGCVRATPDMRQRAGQGFDWVASGSLDEAIGRGPGGEVTEKLAECPKRLHAKGRRCDLGERQREGAISSLRQFALGRPIGTHDVRIKVLDDSMDCFVFKLICG